VEGVGLEVWASNFLLMHRHEPHLVSILSLSLQTTENGLVLTTEFVKPYDIGLLLWSIFPSLTLINVRFVMLSLASTGALVSACCVTMSCMINLRRFHALQHSAYGRFFTSFTVNPAPSMSTSSKASTADRWTLHTPVRDANPVIFVSTLRYPKLSSSNGRRRQPFC